MRDAYGAYVTCETWLHRLSNYTQLHFHKSWNRIVKRWNMEPYWDRNAHRFLDSGLPCPMEDP